MQSSASGHGNWKRGASTTAASPPRPRCGMPASGCTQQPPSALHACAVPHRTPSCHGKRRDPPCVGVCDTHGLLNRHIDQDRKSSIGDVKESHQNRSETLLVRRVRNPCGWSRMSWGPPLSDTGSTACTCYNCRPLDSGSPLSASPTFPGRHFSGGGARSQLAGASN